jgi:hypothetical protein
MIPSVCGGCGLFDSLETITIFSGRSSHARAVFPENNARSDDCALLTLQVALKEYLLKL